MDVFDETYSLKKKKIAEKKKCNYFHSFFVLSEA